MTETLGNITSAVRTDPLEALTSQMMLAAAGMAFQRVETQPRERACAHHPLACAVGMLYNA